MFLVDVVFKNSIEITVFVQLLFLFDLLNVHDKLDQVGEEHFDLSHNTDAYIRIFPEFVRLRIQNQESNNQSNKRDNLGSQQFNRKYNSHQNCRQRYREHVNEVDKQLHVDRGFNCDPFTFV